MVGLFSLGLASEAGAVNIFVWIDGMPGESRGYRHNDWIDALNFTIEIDRGLKGGKVNSGTLVLSKYLDKATPHLGHYCTSGQHINEVRIELVKGGEDPLNYMVYRLQNVTVTSVRAQAKDGKRPTEEVTLRFASITWTYTPQKEDGTGDAAITKSSQGTGKIPRRLMRPKY